MKYEIFIVTLKRDFPYLLYCLKSIVKFATGFSVRILVPPSDAVDLMLVTQLVNPHDKHFPLAINQKEEWEGNGFNWHMAQIMKSEEWCPDADFIVHVDSDCVFTEPVTPEDYVKDGKPIVRYEPYARIAARRPAVGQWQASTQRCLPFPVLNETMRCHPGVFHRDLYPLARDLMAQKTGKPALDYMRETSGLSEFNILGSVAMYAFPKKYIAVEQNEDRVKPHNKLQQFWSRGPIDQPQHGWVLGEEKQIVPLEFIQNLGL